MSEQSDGALELLNSLAMDSGLFMVVAFIVFTQLVCYSLMPCFPRSDAGPVDYLELDEKGALQSGYAGAVTHSIAGAKLKSARVARRQFRRESATTVQR